MGRQGNGKIRERRGMGKSREGVVTRKERELIRGVGERWETLVKMGGEKTPVIGEEEGRERSSRSYEQRRRDEGRRVAKNKRKVVREAEKGRGNSQTQKGSRFVRGAEEGRKKGRREKGC